MGKVYCFGDYYLSYNDILRKGQKFIHLPPKELHLLSVLVENAGDIIKKESLINYVWKGGYVNDESLTRCIYSLRKALGSDAGYVETVYGKGYIFSATVTSSSDRKKVNMLPRSLIIVPDGMSAKVNFFSIYNVLSTYIPQYIKVLSCHSLSPYDSRDYIDCFIEHHRPNYIIYCSDLVNNEGRGGVNITIINSDTQSKAFLGDFYIINNELYAEKRVKENIVNYFNGSQQEIFPAWQSENLILPAYEARGNAALSVKILIDNYDAESLLKAANLTLKQVRGGGSNSAEMLTLAECYIGLMLNGWAKNIHKMSYKAQIIIDKILANEPYNADALAMMGVVKTIAKDNVQARSYLMQAKRLETNEMTISFNYACHLYIKGELVMAYNNICDIERQESSQGRVRLLKKLIQSEINKISVGNAIKRSIPVLQCNRLRYHNLNNSRYQLKNHVIPVNDMHIRISSGAVYNILNVRMNELKRISFHQNKIIDVVDL